MLNIHLYRGDEELIYDDGGGQYEISEARNYALSSLAHNTVSVDSLPQNRTAPYQYTEPYDAHFVSCDAFDYAEGVYDDAFGQTKPASHMRQVRFCKPGFFVVRDTLLSMDGDAHDYELLFHTGPRGPIGEGTIVRDSIIMNSVEIGAGCELNKAIIAENVVVGNKVKLGIGEEVQNDTAPHIYSHGIVTIGEKSVLPDNITVGTEGYV